MKQFIQEFKDFAFRGNVLDLAIGVVIGSAFTGIVTSLVENIINPVVGALTGGTDLAGLSLTIAGAELMYGAFISSIIDFLIIALVIFVFIKLINNAQMKFNKKVEEETAEVELPLTEQYLKEIRDLLADKKDSTI
ncbi:large conductance mechanosensitive channel protein MscL [Desemzia incerta]|uniref:large conductance mechanosensitive channel protein MscL n=1 Tax=Desemzia incerta TaxID=82801 RepID=UPI0024C382EA|nr:large conductance mechanosensitive channel protein MscL [Desemzia incerta]WHZ32992.1 large conductance mechanosensitive channel protein MscL [Desemzia incerta]